MAQLIKKIVRKQSRSTSPVKRRNHEFGRWMEPQHDGNRHQPCCNCSCHYDRSTCHHCHAALQKDHHGWDSHQSPRGMTPVHLDPEEERPVHGANHYEQQSAPNNYIAKHYNQYWNLREKTPPSATANIATYLPSSSEPPYKETVKEETDFHKQRTFLETTNQRLSVPVDFNSSPSGHRKDPTAAADENAITRHRSFSPKKSPSTSGGKSRTKSRSKSPTKKTRHIATVLNYLSPQCQNEGCSAEIVVEDTKFLVCKQQLSHASDYFRSLFVANKSVSISGASQNAMNEFCIVVSSLTHPPPATQFQWFLESVIQAPVFKDLTDDTLETLMRLSKRFRAEGLEMRCSRYIQENVNKKTPMVALCWLNWVLKHKFDKSTHDACLPRVATASLVCLEEHRNMITEKLLADIFAAKLRAFYVQAVNVFQTIHGLDHFFVEVDRCPRCGRQREQSRIRMYISPCKKIIGCERCFKEKECSIVTKNPGSFQAFYRCPHGLIALNERTADCQCQVPLLASHLSGDFRIAPEALEETQD